MWSEVVAVAMFLVFILVMALGSITISLYNISHELEKLNITNIEIMKVIIQKKR